MGIPILFVIAPVTGAILVGLLMTGKRRAMAHVVCPRDHLEREIMLTGNRLDGPVWTDVVECGFIGDKPLKGRALKCNRACLSLPGLPPMH